MELLEIYGQTIKRLREQRQWSQAELGKKAGLHASNISHREQGSGKRRPRESEYAAMARAFGLTLPEFKRALAETEVLLGGMSLYPQVYPRFEQVAKVWGGTQRTLNAAVMMFVNASADEQLRAISAALAVDYDGDSSSAVPTTASSGLRPAEVRPGTPAKHRAK